VCVYVCGGSSISGCHRFHCSTFLNAGTVLTELSRRLISSETRPWKSRTLCAGRKFSVANRPCLVKRVHCIRVIKRLRVIAWLDGFIRCPL